MIKLGECGILSPTARFDSCVSTLTRFQDGIPSLVLNFTAATNLLILASALGFEEVVLLDIVVFNTL
jgi:hypothetical protein